MKKTLAERIKTTKTYKASEKSLVLSTLMRQEVSLSDKLLEMGAQPDAQKVAGILVSLRGDIGAEKFSISHLTWVRD
jgi:hypothetical protein